MLFPGDLKMLDKNDGIIEKTQHFAYRFPPSQGTDFYMGLAL